MHLPQKQHLPCNPYGQLQIQVEWRFPSVFRQLEFGLETSSHVYHQEKKRGYLLNVTIAIVRGSK